MSVSNEVLRIVRELCEQRSATHESWMFGGKTTIMVHGGQPGRQWFFQIKTLDDSVIVGGERYLSNDLDRARQKIEDEINRRV